MEEFEKLRDEVERKIKQGFRNHQLRHKLIDSSMFTEKDLGIKASQIIQQQGRDNGVTNYEIQKAIDKVAWSVKNQANWKEKAVLRWIEKFSSRGYYGYAKLMKAIGLPVESPKIRWWNQRYLNPLMSLINPGGKVSVKAGTYTTTASVVSKDNVVLEGEGPGTIFYLDDNRPTGTRHGVIETASADENIIISNLQVDANKTNQASNPATNGDAWFGIMLYEQGAYGPKKVIVENCWVHDSNAANIEVAFAEDVLIKNNIVYNAGHGGIWVDSGSDRCIVANNITYDNLRGGIFVGTTDYGSYGGGNHLVIGNISLDDGTASTYSAIELYYLRWATITDNIVVGSKFRGIALTHVNSYNVVIKDNYVIDADSDWGIFAVEADDCTVKDNYVFSCGGGIYIANVRYLVDGNFSIGNLASGIELHTATDCLVSNNFCYNNGAWGILIDVNADDNYITNNRTEGNTSGGICVNNANCDNNIIKNNRMAEATKLSDVGTNTIFNNIWVPILDSSDGNATQSNIGDHFTIECTDGNDVTVKFNVTVPPTFQQLMRAQLEVVPEGTGNLRRNVATDWGASGEAYNNGSDSIAASEVAVTANQITLLDLLAAFTGIVAGDRVGVAFTWEGSHANDTTNANLNIRGFNFDYV